MSIFKSMVLFEVQLEKFACRQNLKQLEGGMCKQVLVQSNRVVTATRS